MFVSHDFDYMPAGSYTILFEGEVLYLKPVPDELKERLEADLKRLIAETKERNRKGIYTSKDYY